MKRILFTILFVLIASTLFAQTSPTQSPKGFIERSGKLYRIASLYPGVNVNDASSDQTGMAALLADTSIKNIYFPPGRYTVPSSITNTVSNRTFWFDNGAMIVGVFHVAAGNGTNDIVKNVTVIGNPIVTDRFGMYFCQNIKVDGVTMYDTSAGARGVHIYTGSKDVYIENIYIYKAQNGYGLAIDKDSDSSGVNYEPTNVHIVQLTVVSSDSSGVRLANNRGTKIDNCVIRSFNKLDGFIAYDCNDLRIGYLEINGRGNTVPLGTGASGLRIELDTNAHVEQAFIDCDTATMSAISIVNSTSYPGVTLGSLYLRSSDTVGSKWGLQLSTTKNVWVSKVRATRFGNAIRLVNATNTTILQMQADSSRIGFNTGGTNDTLTILTADFVGNTADNGGTSPQSFSNVRGLLTNPNLYKDSLQIRNTGQITVPSNDTLNGNQAIHGIKMTGTTNVGYRGLSLLWQTTLLGTDRPQVAFKQGLYDATGFGLSDLGVYSRTSSSDSILRKMFEWKHNGRTYIVPNGDSSKAWSFPLDRPTDTTRMLTVTTAGVGTFSTIPSGGGGSGVTPSIDSTAASGGSSNIASGRFRGIAPLRFGITSDTGLIYFDSAQFEQLVNIALRGDNDTVVVYGKSVSSANVILKVARTYDGTVNPDSVRVAFCEGDDCVPLMYRLKLDSLLQVGNGTQIFSGTIYTGEAVLQIVSSTTGLTLNFLDSLILNQNGRNILNIYGTVDTLGDSTTHITLGDNKVLQIHVDAIGADTMFAQKLIKDTCISGDCYHQFYIGEGVPAADSALLGYIKVLGVDSTVWIPLATVRAGGGGGGTATRLGADSSAAQNSPIAFDDTVVFLDGVANRANFETTGDTTTVWYDADTANVLASRQFAQDIAGDSAALRSLSFDTTLGIHTARMPLRWREHPNGTIVFEIGLNAAGDTIKPSVGTGSIGTTFIANNAVTETKIDSTDRHYAVSSFRTDTLRSNKTTPSPIYMQDSIRLVGMVIHDTTGGRAYYQGRTIGTLGQVRSYVPVGSTIDSTAWSTVDSNIIQGVSLPADLVAFTSAELAAKLSNETGSGAAVFGTSPTIDAPTVTTSFTGNVLDSANVKANSLDSQDIKNDAIRGSGREILEASIDSTDLANNSVGATEIAAGEVGNSELASTAVDSTKSGNKTLAVTDINLAGRKFEWAVTQWSTPYMNFGGAAIRQDSSWYWTNPYRLGDSVLLDYMADTSIQFIWADSNINDATDSILHMGFIDIPEDVWAETLYVTAMSSDTALEFDSIRVMVDSTASSTIKGTPHAAISRGTDIDLTTTITRTAVAFAGTSPGTTLYRGGRITVWMLVSTQHASAANAKLKCVSVTVVGRLRN